MIGFNVLIENIFIALFVEIFSLYDNIRFYYIYIIVIFNRKLLYLIYHLDYYCLNNIYIY